MSPLLLFGQYSDNILCVSGGLLHGRYLLLRHILDRFDGVPCVHTKRVNSTNGQLVGDAEEQQRLLVLGTQQRLARRLVRGHTVVRLRYFLLV